MGAPAGTTRDAPATDGSTGSLIEGREPVVPLKCSTPRPPADPTTRPIPIPSRLCCQKIN
jgi:hypothetical protein